MNEKQRAKREAPTVGTVERRTFAAPSPVEIRAEGDSKGIRGIGIAVGVTTDIGPFTEEIDSAALTDEILGQDIRGLYNHDENFVLGRTKSGTMVVRKTKSGVEYDIEKMPASRADVMEAIERGDVDGSSFSFTVLEDAWTRADEKSKPHRRILAFERLYDMGPVAFPAYDGHAVVSARSLAAAAEAGAEIPEDLRAEPDPEETREEPVAEETEETEEKREDPSIRSVMFEGELVSIEGREESDSDFRDRLQVALRAVYPGENSWVYIADVFSRDGYVVFWYETGDENPAMASGLYRSEYTIGEDDSISFGEPVRVRRVTLYEPIARSLEEAGRALAEVRERMDAMEGEVRSALATAGRLSRAVELLSSRLDVETL